MNNSIVKYTLNNGDEVELSPNIIRETITGGNNKITDSEVQMFIELCKYQKINPFLKEAYLIKYGDQPANIVCGKELFMKRAEKHADYDGMSAGIIVITAKGEVVNRPGTVYIYGAETLLGGWATVYRKNIKTPIESTVLISEYDSGKSLWASKPATMIRKVAIVQALRESFPDTLAGLYSQEEIAEESVKEAEEPIRILCSDCGAVIKPSATRTAEELAAAATAKFGRVVCGACGKRILAEEAERQSQSNTAEGNTPDVSGYEPTADEIREALANNG
jgi:phage recombination protein Bet